jgi:hypothetical protein
VAIRERVAPQNRKKKEKKLIQQQQEIHKLMAKQRDSCSRSAELSKQKRRRRRRRRRIFGLEAAFIADIKIQDCIQNAYEKCINTQCMHAKLLISAQIRNHKTTQKCICLRQINKFSITQD